MKDTYDEQFARYGIKRTGKMEPLCTRPGFLWGDRFAAWAARYPVENWIEVREL